jgi:predicted nuclease of restriction endonuclease-like (RecB) superfamily
LNIVNKKYSVLITDIGTIIQQSRERAIKLVNNELVKSYWEIGRHIINFEQHGSERAEYGSSILTTLSKDLTQKHGKGFGRRNILDMRRFYLIYPKWQTVSSKLYWSHYIELLSITDDDERKFYEQQTVNENWSKRELERQINTSLYERLLLSKDKKGILKLTEKSQSTLNINEIIKDPYVLDFLKIPQHKKITEKHLEQKIIDNLQLFIMELGKGFAFIGRQYRISIGNQHFYVDLVFYHRILKCFVLIDLKIKRVKHQDIGQMNLYLNYFKTEENTAGDHEPIGIILSAEKDEVLVEFATGGISNKIFVSKYQLYLPNKEILQAKVEEILNDKK